MKNKKLNLFKSTVMMLIALSLLTPSANAAKVSNQASRIIAVGDLHGDLQAFLTILKSRDLIDQRGAWTGGKTQLVVVGDYHDRGPDTRYIMDYFFELKSQAQSAGGRLQVVMGNHEMMVISGDLRYATEPELESFEGFPAPQLVGRAKEQYEELITSARASARQAYAPIVEIEDGTKQMLPFPELPRESVEGFVAAHFGNSKYANWIREGAAMIQIGKNMFLHGGVTEWAYKTHYSKVNDMIKNWTHFFQGLIPMPKSSTEWSIGEDGPLWDRRMATNKLKLKQVKKILSKLGVSQVIVGHTTAPEVRALYENRVFAIDTGNSVYYDGRLSSIEIINDQTPTTRYVDRSADMTPLYRQLVCRYRAEQRKACNR